MTSSSTASTARESRRSTTTVASSSVRRVMISRQSGRSWRKTSSPYFKNRSLSSKRDRNSSTMSLAIPLRLGSRLISSSSRTTRLPRSLSFPNSMNTSSLRSIIWSRRAKSLTSTNRTRTSRGSQTALRCSSTSKTSMMCLWRLRWSLLSRSAGLSLMKSLLSPTWGTCLTSNRGTQKPVSSLKSCSHKISIWTLLLAS